MIDTTPHLAHTLSDSLPMELPADEPLDNLDKTVPPTDVISETQAQDNSTQINSIDAKSEENLNTDSQVNAADNNNKIPIWITWTGFYGIWFFWLTCCFSTFIAFEVILGTLGGGVMRKYKLEVLGYKIPVQHLISGVFAGSLEVGSLAATWLTRRQEEDEEK